MLDLDGIIGWYTRLNDENCSMEYSSFLLQSVQAAVEQQLQNLMHTDPRRRVAVITFGDEVMECMKTIAIMEDKHFVHEGYLYVV